MGVQAGAMMKTQLTLLPSVGTYTNLEKES